MGYIITLGWLCGGLGVSEFFFFRVSRWFCNGSVWFEVVPGWLCGGFMVVCVAV